MIANYVASDRCSRGHPVHSERVGGDIRSIKTSWRIKTCFFPIQGGEQKTTTTSLDTEEDAGKSNLPGYMVPKVDHNQFA